MDRAGTAAGMGWPLSPLAWAGLELKTERHLNLPRAADRLVYDAQTEWTVVERSVGLRRATVWQRIRPFHGDIVVELVLRDIIERKIKARRVGQVEDVEAVLQRDAFGDFGVLHDGYVRAPLRGLPEDIALARREVGFESVARRNRAVQPADRQQRQSKAAGVKRVLLRRGSTVSSRHACESALWRAARCQRHD